MTQVNGTKKKVPMRMCIGCQEMKNKKELVRVVKSEDGSISIDLTGKKNGRGAYICRDAKCLEKAQKCKGLERSLQMAITPSVYESLREELM